MSKKLNHTLIVAAAGSGKTNELIERIITKSKTLPFNKFLIVITYTNAATNEISERLAQKIVISPNIFIGTIHSFLIRFFIKPYGKILGLVPEDICITDYDLKVKAEYKNVTKMKLAEKGILDYDYVITLAKKILENKIVKDSISKRISYIFIDEFQDTANSEFFIIEALRKAKNTEVVLVGDPEQSIMGFRKKEKKERAIETIQKGRTYNVQFIEENHRSSETIVNFINNFHSTIKQRWCNKELSSKNEIFYIRKNSINEILLAFNTMCLISDYCENIPRKRFFLAYENKLYKSYTSTDFKHKSQEEKSVMLLMEEYIVATYNKPKKQLKEEWKIDELEFREKCFGLVKEAQNHNVDSFIVTTQNTFGIFRNIVENKVSINIKNLTKNLLANLGYKIKIGAEELQEVNEEFEDYYLTIHKSKGLQADAVLVIAKTKNELMRWLETNPENRLNDKLDTCRLGYVAFSRAKEFLCIACLEKLTTEEEYLLTKLGLTICEVNHP